MIFFDDCLLISQRGCCVDLVDIYGAEEIFYCSGVICPIELIGSIFKNVAKNMYDKSIIRTDILFF
ncbi:hypothetical protein GL58_23685 [Comamonas testosteroni]|uniref:Uncharacterized protein n=1 Tax=Comamonas testosteroni TaxID=285 RepID=A0A0L7N5I3_COMTE|nr:hypothetical protein GL58_23685 [Comamonas testosteroni]